MRSLGKRRKKTEDWRVAPGRILGFTGWRKEDIGTEVGDTRCVWFPGSLMKRLSQILLRGQGK